MKVAITGQDGFIGKHLVSSLRNKKITIISFDKKKHNLFKKESLKNFLTNVDVVIHLAGANIGSNQKAIKINSLGTLGLVDAMVEFNKQAMLVFSSSFQVYVPESMYGLSKKFAEDEIRFYSKKYAIQSLILRLTNIYGPGCRPFYNSAIATFDYMIRKNKIIKINGNGNQKRDFLYVDDAVDAFIKSLEIYKKNTFDIIDICSGKKVSIRKVLEMMQHVYSKKIFIQYNETKENAWKTPANYSKAKHLLRWEPRVPLQDGLFKLYWSNMKRNES